MILGSKHVGAILSDWIICYILHYIPSQLQPIPTDMWITTLFIDNGNLKYACMYIYKHHYTVKQQQHDTSVAHFILFNVP